MVQFFKNLNIDWLGKRRIFIAISVTLMLSGMFSALYRNAFHPRGTEAFNLGVDFKGGTVLTVKFKRRPDPKAIRAAIDQASGREATIQPILDKADEVLIKLPRQESDGADAAAEGVGVDAGRTLVAQALTSFGDGNAEIVGTDAVGAVAGRQLRNQAVAVTLLALVSILLFIALRFEWTYGAAAVIAVFHTVLITLGMFSIFQWEVNLTVIAGLLTLVGFSVNDSIVVFDRIRENLRLHRRSSLYDITNLSINQTLSRTVITAGLVFLSVLALVLFGGETLRPFSLALLIGIVVGTYDSIAIASPIMVWWQQRLGAAGGGAKPAEKQGEASKLTTAQTQSSGNRQRRTG